MIVGSLFAHAHISLTITIVDVMTSWFSFYPRYYVSKLLVLTEYEASSIGLN